MVILKDKLIHKFPSIIKVLLSIIVLFIFFRQLFLKEWFIVITCIFVLTIMVIPEFLTKKYKIEFPNTLETMIYLFIFSAEILGEIGEYYISISWWDNLLHLVSGFALGGVGIFLIDKLNNSPMHHLSLSPFFVVLVSICFSVTVLTFWEVFEYTSDVLVHTDMQKDTVVSSITSAIFNSNGKKNLVTYDVNSLIISGKGFKLLYGGYVDIGLHDTMFDLIIGIIGASCYSFCAYFYLKRKDKKGFASNFIPRYRI